MKYLLEQKANYRHQASRGITVFHYCISHGNEACFSLLCQYAQDGLLPPASPTQRFPLDISDNDGQTPLMLACRMNYDRIVHLLLKSGINPSLRSFRGDNALTIAIQCNALECVKELTATCGFIDSRSKLHFHGALYTAARLNELAIVRHLVGYPEYVSQFISEMLRYPSRSEEIIVEVALREVASSRPQEVIDELSLLCIKNASLCMKLLFDVCKGRPHHQHYSLAGLAEVAKWCIKLSKVLTHSTIIADLDPYWKQIEYLVAQQSQKHCEQTIDETRVDVEGHEEIIEEHEHPKIIPNSSTKLLLSFLEIYVLGHYNLTTHTNEDKEESLHRLQSISCLHSRLLQFFSKYKEYLRYICSWWVMIRLLVKADPEVYDMLHFFKHSFTLFLNNC